MAPSNEDAQSISPGYRMSMKTFGHRTTSALDHEEGKATVDYYKVVKARQNLLFIEKENQKTYSGNKELL